MVKKLSIIIICLCTLAIGCVGSKTASSNNVSASSRKIELYVPNKTFTKWEVKEEKVDISDIGNVIKELKDSNLCCIPKDTKVNSVKIKNNIAYVDLSKDFDDSQTSSSAATIAKIYSIVNTLCLNECFNVNGVKFLIDGEEVETIGPINASIIKTPKTEL